MSVRLPGQFFKTALLYNHKMQFVLFLHNCLAASLRYWITAKLALLLAAKRANRKVAFLHHYKGC